MNFPLEKYNKQQLFNLLSIYTKAIKIMLRNKTKNNGFWLAVSSREAIINEMDFRKANK